MKTCLFCNNQRTFNIHDDYGNNNHTIKDDMLVFFGYQIESHLKLDDVLCHVCMNVMDTVAKLKKRLLPFIFRSNSEEDCKPVKLTKIWDALSTINFDEDGDVILSCPSPARLNLLDCKQIVSYESSIEEKLAEIERQRSLILDRSKADSEVSKISKRGRRRKRGNNWTRRKNGRYSDTKSFCSVTTRASYARSNVSRAPSVMSSESYESFYLPGSPATVYTPASCITSNPYQYQSIEITQNNDIDNDFISLELHECPEDGCTFICENIELMSHHKEVKHKQLPLYFCDFCKKKFTQKCDLNIHMRKHVKQFPCPICKREFFKATELTFHWQKHLEKSVQCSYCQKRYKDQKVLDNHMKKLHTGNIPSRVDYKTCEEPKIKNNYHYQVFFKVQPNEPIKNN